MDAKFVNTDSSVTNVLQVCMGAKFRGIRQAYWKDSNSVYLDIVDEHGEIIGEASDYTYGGRGYSLWLNNGSFAGFVSLDQIQILEGSDD